MSDSLFRLFDAMFSSTSATYPPESVYQLTTGEYLKAGATIIISERTGTGMSFFTFALGECARRLRYKVKYYSK